MVQAGGQTVMLFGPALSPAVPPSLGVVPHGKGQPHFVPRAQERLRVCRFARLVVAGIFIRLPGKDAVAAAHESGHESLLHRVLPLMLCVHHGKERVVSGVEVNETLGHQREMHEAATHHRRQGNKDDAGKGVDDADQEVDRQLDEPKHREQGWVNDVPIVDEEAIEEDGLDEFLDREGENQVQDRALVGNDQSRPELRHQA
mmetsp:Transcript_109355/g.308578  ORF Transcript_109355/g.308578 Transcript_109355/m.308578 type:complete len:202 (-) Transcript_109355:447-1052(-)